MFKHAVIIAGGYGSRMRPLTDYLPKPLVKVNNQPLIKHVVDFLRTNGVQNITVSYGYKGNMVLDEIHQLVETFINTIDKDNSYFLFNTLVKHINEPIVVCPSDMIIELDLQKVYEEYINLNEPAACIVPVRTELDADSIVIDTTSSRITNITREQSLGIYASGIQILNPFKINELIPPFVNFYDVWRALIKKDSLYATKAMPTHWRVFDKLSDLSCYQNIQ